MNIDCDKESLFLSDDLIFYTVEGEGRHIGKPSVFMRMSMCNLTCIGFASADSPNGCDSYVSWSVKNKMTFNEIFDFMENKGYIDKLHAGAIWKLTGGEPLIQQKQLLKLCQAFKDKYAFLPHIDFETNATLLPDAEWKTFNATFTTSPKLTINGDPEEKTYKPDVLKWHVDNGSDFKFVISKSEDLDEIYRKYISPDSNICVPRTHTWFMPCCGSRKEHIEVATAVVEYAKAMCVNFSPRLHLLVWDLALRV
jgi:7-carboxy-7-deazaguanine synthase